MFGLFKKKSEKEMLGEKYKKLMAEAHRLSTTNRKLSDEKVYEADQVLKKMDQLD
ncbi:Lacal_2735 family protein [Zeaxanthinibacter enoshimensis]|uniref:Lacal_2735 family protein n=1 Tax=Zeaxanthinibacter enoshimensis TaxID=392009 RepID=UPI0035688980